MSEPAQGHWLHDLRNALNAVSIGITVAKRLLEEGQLERAMNFLERAEADCERTRRLVNGDMGNSEGGAG